MASFRVGDIVEIRPTPDTRYAYSSLEGAIGVLTERLSATAWKVNLISGPSHSLDVIGIAERHLSLLVREENP
jgi:hypothetical protein